MYKNGAEMANHPKPVHNGYTARMSSWAMGKIRSLELDAVLPLGVEAARVNELIEAHVNRRLKDLKEDFQVFQEAVTPRLPPLPIKYMTWKTGPVLKNIVVGGDPDEGDYSNESDESRLEGNIEPFSPFHTDHTDGGHSSGISSSDGPTGLSAPNFRFGPDLERVVPAEHPLLTYLEANGEDHLRQERTLIFANDFFEVRRSSIAGWGAFAKKKLYEGDKILVEKALYHATHEEVQACVEGLPEDEKKVANDLHAYYGRDGETQAEAIWSTNAFASRYPKDAALAHRKMPGACYDVAGLFPVAARFNHSCQPKIQYKYEPDDEVLVFTVRDWEIEKGSELTISYGKDPSVLYYKYGFECSCGYCGGFDASKWNY